MVSPIYVIFIALLPAVFGRSAETMKRADNDVIDLGAGLFERQGDQTGVPPELDILSTFHTSGAVNERDAVGMVERLNEAVKEAEAAFNAGTLKLGERRDKRSTHSYTMCVFCDTMCENQIVGAGSSLDDYFGSVTDAMNTILQSIDAGSSFSLAYKLQPGSEMYLNWFQSPSASNSVDKLASINDAFWSGSGLWDMSVNYGCDVDFMMASSNDPSWNYLGSVAGIANMMQLCLGSFSVVKMSSIPSNTASLMMHEFGHMIGAYHDGPLDDAFTSLASYFAPGGMLSACSGEYSTLESECTTSTPNGHVMDAVVHGATTFSSCSNAYFNMFLCMADVMPTWYSTDCV